MIRLIGAVDGNADVVRLLLRQRGQLHPDFFQMQPGHFFVEPLRQAIDGRLVFGAMRPQIELGEALVGEGIGHDKARMSFGAAEIYEPSFRQQINAPVAGQVIAIHLRLDVDLLHAGRLVQPVHLDFVVEVADVAHDRLVFHLAAYVPA